MKKQIALRAWELVTNFSSLKKLNFVSSIFGTAWLLLILFYQSAYILVKVFGKQDEALHYLYNLPKQSYFIPLLIGIITIFILYAVLNPITRGGMIHMMQTYRQNNGKKYHRSWQGFFDGFTHFLPIFKIQNITAIFAPITIITSFLFVTRIFGGNYIELVAIIMGLYLIFSFLLNICFAYAPFFVVFEGKKGIESISASTGMAISNIGITTKLYFTNILLYLRILILGGIFFLMPFVVSGILTYITLVEVKIIFLVIFAIISFILFLLIAHLNSTLEIFILAVWYEAYLVCKEEEKAHNVQQ